MKLEKIKSEAKIIGQELRAHTMLYIITAVLASCSILYELIIAQTLSLLAANTVIWYSITVGLFLLGMGLGAFVSKFIGVGGRTIGSLVTTEIILSLVGILIVPYLHVAHMLYSSFAAFGQDLVGIFFFFLGGLSGAFTIGLLTGIELPLLIRIREEIGQLDRNGTHAVLGVDYVGSLIGAILFPIVLVPNLDLLLIALLVASVNAITAIVIVLKLMKFKTRAVFHGVAGVTLLLVAAYTFGKVNRIEQYFLKKYYHYLEAADTFETLFAPMPDFPTVTRHASAYQKIDLVEDPATSMADAIVTAYSDKFTEKPDFPKKKFLFLNGDFQMTSSHEEIYHEYFAHVPIQLRAEIPRDVLVLGGGDGILVRELIKYPEVNIKHLDLDAVLIGLAKNHPILTAINENALHDSRVNTIIGDGYKFMRDSEETFDAIYIDFPAPADYNISKLYSREFFHFVLQRLNPNGFMVFDATGIGFLTPPGEQMQEPADGNDWPIYYNTVKAAGFQKIIPYITTLEVDNPKARQMLEQVSGNMLLGDNVASLIMQTTDKAEQEMILRLAQQSMIHTTLVDHTMSLQQGFIVASPSDTSLKRRRFVNLGVNLRVLNEQRYHLAFDVDFPTQDEVEWSYVNSILKPTFPTSPWYQPRLSF